MTELSPSSESAPDDVSSHPPGASSDPSDPFGDPVSRISGGYRSLAFVLGLAGVASLLHLAQHGSWVRVAALLFVGLGARVLWARLRLPDGLGAAFTPERASATTLLCATFAGFGVVQTSPLLGVIAATLTLLASWLTSPASSAASP